MTIHVPQSDIDTGNADDVDRDLHSVPHVLSTWELLQGLLFAFFIGVGLGGFIVAVYSSLH